MNKAYDKVVWVNAPSTSSPLNQTNLNKMSDALDTVDDRVVAMDTTVSGKADTTYVNTELAKKVNKVTGKGLSTVESMVIGGNTQVGQAIASITILQNDGNMEHYSLCNGVEIDDEMSTTSENPVQNKVIYAELQNLLPEETVAGNPISISDASGLSAKSCEVTFSPIQSGSGDPSPTNIRPISGWNSLVLQQSGSNMYGGEYLCDDILAKVNNSFADKSLHRVQFSGSNITNVVLFDKFRSNTQYTFILYGKNTNNNSKSTNLHITYNDDSISRLEFITAGSDSYCIFTTPENKSVVDLHGDYMSQSTNLDYDKCGIFEGVLTVDGFQPYNGQTHTATFPDTVYGGKWLPQEGKAVIEWVAVDLGDFDYVYDSTNQLFTKSTATITDILPPDTNDVIVNAISENYKTVSSNNMFVAENNNCFGVSTGKVFRIKDTRYTDATQFKAAMSGVYLCYKLSTPTEITFTAEQIELLKGQNVLWTDGDNITLTYTADIKTWVQNQLAQLS